MLHYTKAEAREGQPDPASIGAPKGKIFVRYLPSTKSLLAPLQCLQHLLGPDRGARGPHAT